MEAFADCCGSADHSQLFQEVLHVRFDGSFGDEKLGSDFLVAFAGRDPLKNFDFAAKLARPRDQGLELFHRLLLQSQWRPVAPIPPLGKLGLGIRRDQLLRKPE
jgi:hypothetical protein